jgi:hypothetical protein
MNQRIRELAEQAWDDTKEKFGSFVDDGGEVDFTFLHAYDQKFAELIIQECVEVCAGIAAVRAGYNDVNGRDTADSCGDTIKEYFGVEHETK